MFVDYRKVQQSAHLLNSLNQSNLEKDNSSILKYDSSSRVDQSLFTLIAR